MKPKAYITQKTYPDETRWFIWVAIGNQQKLVTSFRCDTPEQQAECMAFFDALDHNSRQNVWRFSTRWTTKQPPR